MQLHEMIHHLRVQAGMSQGDLADQLEVSRQSVSKWETGGAVPDLDKLVKMAELFGVSLDELVKGEAAPAKESEPKAEPQVIYVERAEPAMPRRKIVGWVLFGFAVLTVLLCTILSAPLEGLVLASPFWLCGIICFVSKKRPGLWCCWTLFGLVEVYLRFATGISAGSLYALIRNFIRNDAAVIISAVLSLLLCCLVWATVRSFRDRVLELNKKTKARFGIKLAALAVCCLPWTGWLIRQLIEVTEQDIFLRMTSVIQIIALLCQWGQVILFTWLLIDLLAIRRWKRGQLIG